MTPMSIKTRLVLLALAAVSVGVAVALDRWNRQLEAAVAFPERHPSIPGSLRHYRGGEIVPATESDSVWGILHPGYHDEVTDIPADLLDRLSDPGFEKSRRYWLGEWS